MRIMFLTNSPVARSVGYGTLVRQLTTRLRPFHDVAVACNYGVHGGKSVWEGIPVYPAGMQGFNESLILEHARDFNADVVLSVYDMHALSYFPQQMKQENKIKWVAYSPLDTDVPSERYIEILKGAHHIIPMSKHGEEAFDKAYPDKTFEEIPGGVDTDVFRPLSNTGALKKKLGFPEDCFLVLFAGDSRWYRKNVAENLEGFKLFAEAHPELNPRLFVHSIVHAQDGGSYDIQSLIKTMGLEKLARCTDPYRFELGGITDMELAEVYNAADVLLHVSAGEGLGLMTLEANACGTPAIYSEFTAQPEYSRGVAVYPTIERYNFANVKQAIPAPEAISLAIAEVAAKGKSYYREECVSHARQYDWRSIVENYWLPYFRVLEDDLKGDCLEPPKPQKNTEVVVYD